MTVSISNSSSIPPGSVASATASSPTPDVAQQPAETPGDSVKLSQAAQVHLFKQQGQSLSQISANLGISLASVDGYLGIAVAKTPSASVPTAAPAGGGSVETIPASAKG